MSKKLLNVLLSLTMVVAMIPSMSMVVFAKTTYGVCVAGTQITDGNKDNVLNDGTVSYNPSTNTLTLNGIKFTKD